MSVATPKISVIVTSYNDAPYIEHCLENLTKQTFKDIEIICVDDASTDKTCNIIKAHMKKDPRIRLIQQEKNSGISVSRNTGMADAKGTYIMFSDADDYYDITTCEKMYDAMTLNNVDWGICEIGVTYEYHSEMKASDDCYYKLKFSGRQLMHDEMLKAMDLSVDNKIFRRDIIEKYHLQFPVGRHYEDACFAMLYAMFIDDAYFINEQLYHYTRHKNSIMSQTWSKSSKVKDTSIDHIYIFIYLHEQLEKNGIMDQHLDFFWSFFADYIVSAYNWSKSKASRIEIRRVVQKFIKENETEILKIQPQHQKRLKKVGSSYYRSDLWKLVEKLKSPFYRLSGNFRHLFCKITNSQKWTIARMDNLNIDVNSQTARIIELRRKLRK